YPIRLVSCSGSLCTAVRGGSNGTSCHELRIDEQLLPEPDERAQCFGRGLFRDQLLNQMSDPVPNVRDGRSDQFTFPCREVEVDGSAGHAAVFEQARYGGASDAVTL